MSFSSSLSGFDARLREFIRLSLGSSWISGQQKVAGAGFPAEPPDASRLFDALARELFALQHRHNSAYRRLCEARGITVEAIEHWSQIPSVPTAAFKELELSCLLPEQRSAVFHSSGTTEQRPSRHFHSHESLRLYEASALPWFTRHLLPELGAGAKPVLQFLTPPPERTPRSSLVHMFEMVRQELGGVPSTYWGSVDADGSWTLNSAALVEALRADVRAERPVMILGTAFLFVHLLDYLTERQLRFQLPPGSRVLETGGYKGRSRTLPKAELHALIRERLGIPAAEIVCEYGMSELSSQAYDRIAGGEERTGIATRRFRFPPWARVQVVSPETGREVGEGETGLIRVFDLANAFSVMAIQTEDLGIRRGEGFELVGRAAMAEPRGCSLMAS